MPQRNWRIATREELGYAAFTLALVAVLGTVAGLWGQYAVYWISEQMRRPDHGFLDHMTLAGIPTIAAIALASFSSWILWRLMVEAWRRFHVGTRAASIWE